MRMPDYMKIGDGPITIFLLHGGYGSKDYWAYEIPELVGKGYRVVAWDAPGYGLSPLPEDYSIEMVADHAAHLVTELGTDRNIVIGHSMGGIVGPKVAQLIPGRIHALVISASIASLAQGGEEFARDFIEKRVPPLRKVKTLAEAAMPLLKSMFAPQSSGPAVDLVLDVAGKTPSETFIQAMLAIQRYEGAPVVQALDIPVLCVGGRADPVAQPQLIEQTAALIPGAEMKIFENTGHYPFAEDRDAFNAVLFDFLARNNLAP
ncbi:alpha/beta hydrolase [Sphingobium jiangsuense]|uniref:Pimeloyl-ACP methyl ester carboxylesterase n=1 Tax=Sphingobium jiangsuense TaxID=870476 RepID=A0A7W6BJ13_9SPHN|nr:alpha/beta hydrolase [Sphingobium jiangsuense]MBB3925956.1 pimeloyl-ACP methyl ester carboxylesterase [Sphingobium jiangsuense]GLS98890.1 alpha/beta hydrolase [Sphingobium jiangsuense]